MDILDEVRDDLKQETLVNLAKKYGKHVVLLFFAVLIGVSYQVVNSNINKSKAEKSAESYFNAFNHSENEALAILTGIIKNGSAGYRDLALLTSSQILIDKGDRKSALPVLENASRDSDSAAVRDLAGITALKIKLEDPDLSSKITRGDFEKFSGSTSPFRYSALELEALWHIKMNKKEEAKKIIDKIISDTTAPAKLRNRAKNLANAY